MENKVIFKRWIYIGIFFLISSSYIFLNNRNIFAIVPVLIGSAISISVFFCRKFHSIILISILYLVLLLFVSKSDLLLSEGVNIAYFIYFYPLFVFVMGNTVIPYKKSSSCVLYLSAVILLGIFSLFEVYIMTKSGAAVFVFLIYTILSYTVSRLLLYTDSLKDEYFKLYSDSEKEGRNMKIMYKDLINSQDEKIKNAILTERNRISRDIHDSLGHLTSRGILQIGAMIVTEKDEERKKQLSQLKDTLSDGMNEVRNSLHNFQNESIDLEEELQSMIDSFDFCKVIFSYSVNCELNLKQKYSIIYIVKESLTNISKHSNGNLAEINIVNMNDRIYIKIYDNGNDIKEKTGGMGIFSIRKRVEDLGGNTDISTDNGFRIFISFKV